MSFVRIWIKICLFLVSYFPLFIIMSILHYDHVFIPYVGIVFSIIGFGGFFITLRVYNKIQGERRDATDIKSEGIVNFQYFLAYIIPFVAMDIDQTRQLLAYLVLFIFIGILYVKTDLIYVNPTLTILGFNLLRFKTEYEDAMLITRNNVEKALSNNVIPMDRGLYYERSAITT